MVKPESSRNCAASCSYWSPVARDMGLLRSLLTLVVRRAGGDERHRDAAALLDARGLAGEIAEVVEAGATHAATRHHFDLLDARRVQREDALDADAVAHLAHGEGGASAALGALDDHALEHLG